MSFRRTTTALAATSSLLLVAFTPLGAAAPMATATGTAATTSVPLLVETAGTDVALGTLALLATTDDTVAPDAPFASTSLTLADVGGARFGDLQARSDGTSTLPGASVDRATPVGGVVAEAASLLANADDDSAVAGLTTLATSVGLDLTELDGLANPLLLEAQVSNVTATVNDSRSAASHTLLFGGLDLGMDHLLGDALGTLPLDDLLALADALPGVVPDLSTLGLPADTAAALTDLLDAVTAAETGAAVVASAATALTNAEATDPLVDYPAFGNVAALEGQVALLDGLDATVGGVAGVIAAVAGLNSVILTPQFATLGCVLTPAALDANVVNTRIAETLACVQGALDDLEAAIAALDDELAALDLAVSDYLAAVSAVEDALTALDDLTSLLDTDDLLGAVTELLDDVLAADVVRSAPVGITQQVNAIGGEPAGSSANTDCGDSSATILGTVLATEDCAHADAGAVQPALDALSKIFDAVPAVDAGDGITLALFGTVEDEVTEATDGTVTATSVAEVLRLEIPTLAITPCAVADGLACSLGIDLDGLVGGALTDVDGALDGAFTTVEDALTNATDVLSALDEIAPDVSAGSTIEDTVETALGTLDGIVDGIDLDGLLAGDQVTLPGATVVVDPQLEAEHLVTTAAVDTPSDPGSADPAPTPTDDPTLPNTGGGAAMLALLALGAGAWLRPGRRRKD